MKTYQLCQSNKSRRKRKDNSNNDSQFKTYNHNSMRNMKLKTLDRHNSDSNKGESLKLKDSQYRSRNI